MFSARKGQGRKSMKYHKARSSLVAVRDDGALDEVQRAARQQKLPAAVLQPRVERLRTQKHLPPSQLHAQLAA
jgi:hypothetical protein